MKMHYELSKKDKLIILILSVNGKTDIKKLFQIAVEMEIFFEDIDLDGVIRHFCEQYEKRLLNKDYYEIYPMLTVELFLNQFNETLIILEKLGIVHRSSTDSDIFLKNPEKIAAELTPYGAQIVQKLRDKRRIILRSRDLKRQIFIASKIGDNEIDELFYREIKPIVNSFNYEAIRIDVTEPTQTLTDSIIENIISAKLLIADLTFARPSVYFEAGIAFGLGIPMILTCRKDHLKGINDSLKVHFDLEQFKISYWEVKDSKYCWPKEMELRSRLEKVLSN